MNLHFHLRLAWRSLARTPAFTAVMLTALAFGVASWYLQHQVFTVFGKVALPERGNLLNVAVARPRGQGTPLPTTEYTTSLLLDAADARALLGSGVPRRETLTFASFALVQGASTHRVRARYVTRDFFAMFEIPFAEGGAWSAGADAGGLGADTPLAEVVLDATWAATLFPAGGAVGRSLRVNGQDVRVVGVVDAGYQDDFRLYDMHTFSERPEPIYLPVASAARAHALPEFLHAEAVRAGGFADLLASRDAWLLIWVELPDAAARAAFQAHVQRALPGAPPAVLRDPPSLRRVVRAGDGAINLWPLLAALSLAASLLNLVRLLMAKFAGRAQDLGLLRAFGARRRALVGQLLVEAGLVGLLAGGLGVLIGVAMMPWAGDAVYTVQPVAAWRLPDVLLTVAVSTAIALLAAIYPAWRVGRGTPCEQLRRA